MATRPPLPHLPALDGLRGLALLGVLLFHSNGLLKGGFLGVDLFLVLSGFLITRLLMAEQLATGSIDLRAFWVRRARRLFPALLALMPAIALFAHFVARRDELAAIRAEALATLAYVANWRSILSHKSYWELFRSPSPLEHTWSLSIEEQFYVVWPVIVLLVLRWRGARALLGLVLSLGALSVLAMLVLFDPERTTRVYYGTDTRAAALLGGAALAIVLARSTFQTKLPLRFLDLGGVLSLGGLGYAWWTIDGRDAFLYRGGFWLTEAFSLVLVACATLDSRSIVARVLSFGPLRAMGAVSYGAYLWHWPIYLVLTAERCGIQGVGLHAARWLLTFAIAAVSYRFLEEPIRRNGLPARRALWLVPAATALSFATVVLATRVKPSPILARSPVENTASAAPVLTRFRVRLLGDSTANSLGWSLRNAAAQDVEVQLRAKDGLNLIDADDIRWPSDDSTIDATVISLGGAFLYGIHVHGKWTEACHPKWDGLFETGLDRHIKELAESKAPVWITTAPYPLGSYDNARRRTSVDCINTSIRRIASKYPKIRILDLFEMLCPKGTCEREHNGLAVRMDGVHFNIPAAKQLARRVLAEIDPVSHRLP